MGINRSLGRLVLGVILVTSTPVRSQQTAPPLPTPQPLAPEALPPVPRGVEVLARGPVHEAFASLTADPAPTPALKKRPPKPLEEMPPEVKPEGKVLWIGGYWAWDDDRKDYLWVSGVWRTPPPGKQWIAGYWRETEEGWQWVPGFWTTTPTETKTQEVTYLPAPPATPEVAPPKETPPPDAFFVPGYWVWNGRDYAWRAGYWARVQPGYVWVPAHYRWTPTGYLFIPGYWDIALPDRGILYAPVVVDPVAAGPTFVYTPTYVVRDTIVVDALFVRPSYCHYYFGDYYGPAYRNLGYQSCYVYSQRRYDSLIVYERYTHRNVPNWDTVQLNLYVGRDAGQMVRPPRTLVQQNNLVVKPTTVNVTNITNITNVQNVSNTTVLTTASQLTREKGTRTVSLDSGTRQQVKQQALSVQNVASQRGQLEKPVARGQGREPRLVKMEIPPQKPVQIAHGPARAQTTPAPEKPALSAHNGVATPTPQPGGTTPHPRSTQPVAPGNSVQHSQSTTSAPMGQPGNPSARVGKPGVITGVPRNGGSPSHPSPGGPRPSAPTSGHPTPSHPQSTHPGGASGQASHPPQSAHPATGNRPAPTQRKPIPRKDPPKDKPQKRS